MSKKNEIKIKMKNYLSGLIIPQVFNSNGKPIGFAIESVCGNRFVLQADNLLKSLRKRIYQKVKVQGELRQRNGKQYYLVRGVA